MFLSSQRELPERQNFVKKLFDFLSERGISNLKIPQIGGKELDLMQLYNSVIRRGGAQKVTNNKLWKEIVSEFDLPPSCTSASFTLKNHYQKYLLAFEQKNHFGKSEDEMVRELGSVRQNRRPEDSWGRNETQVPRDYNNDSNLKVNLKTAYGGRQSTESITFLKKSRTIPTSSEIRRITLAFESKIQKEVRFALNSLLLYSCVNHWQFYLEQNPELFESLVNYWEDLLVKQAMCFDLSKIQDLFPANQSLADKFEQSLTSHKKPKSSSFARDLNIVKQEEIEDNEDDFEESSISQQNGASSTNQQNQENCSLVGVYPKRTKIDQLSKSIMHLITRSSQPFNADNSYTLDMASLTQLGACTLELLRKKQENFVTNTYETISLLEVQEQCKMISLIIRNMVLVNSNDVYVFQHKRAFELNLKIFFGSLDQELQRYSIETMASLCKYIIIPRLLNKEIEKSFIQKIIEHLNSEVQEEYEAALDCMHNLMLSQENEIFIESLIPDFVGSLIRLLMSSSNEVIETSLEILCYLSDLKMNTRLLLAKQPNFISRLLALIAGNHSQSTEKRAKLAGMVLQNVSMSPATKVFFQPHEQEIFFLSSNDEAISEILGQIIGDLQASKINTADQSKQFYERWSLKRQTFDAQFQGQGKGLLQMFQNENSKSLQLNTIHNELD